MDNTEKMLEILKKAREAAGTHIGPRKPIPPAMLKRIQEGVDKANSKSSSSAMMDEDTVAAKKGGAVKKMASGGAVSASRRADGIAQRGKTRGKMC